MNIESRATSEGADRQPRFPIATVARRTGLSEHLLRAWERRYGAVVPARTEGGARLYSTADVFRLRLLARVVAAGHPIGRMASLPAEELLALVAEEPAAAGGVAAPSRPGSASAGYVAGCLEAVESMDGARIHAILSRAAMALGAREFSEGVVVPLLRRVGELWEGGAVCPAQEHVVSVQVHRVLSSMLSALPVAAGAPTAVVTTPSGHRHELAALLAAVEAAGEGWKVAYLGPDLPAGDIASAVEATRASAVILSVVRAVEGPELARELETLRRRLGESVPVLVGGRGTAAHRERIATAGGTWLPDLPSLRAVLHALGGGERAGTEPRERRAEAE